MNSNDWLLAGSGGGTGPRPGAVICAVRTQSPLCVTVLINEYGVVEVSDVGS